MVPVLSRFKTPLAPCSEKRARKLMEKKEAKAYWKQGIFCIIMQRDTGIVVPEVIVAFDTGSKRTGVTVATEKSVVLNLLQNAPDWVKSKMESRKILRRSRRNRKTPYRKCRFNRKIVGVPPSTKARWQAHLRTIKVLASILPIKTVVIEDIKAKTKKGARKWNLNFSPLEVGKQWFESEVTKNFKIKKFLGFDTYNWRNYRGFKKTKNKLSNVWEAHNVDSHCLCEMYLGVVPPFKGILRVNFLNYFKRQLHVQNPIKGGIRKQYGGTLSLGLKRGTLVKHPKYGKVIIGGSSNGRMSLHNVLDGKRLTQNAKIADLIILSRQIWSSQFLPFLKGVVSLAKDR